MHLISMGGNDKMPFHRETLQKWGKIEHFVCSVPKVDSGLCTRKWIPLYSKSQILRRAFTGPLVLWFAHLSDNKVI